MSTSIILLDQNFNAIDVDIMVFEPSVLYEHMVRHFFHNSKLTSIGIVNLNKTFFHTF